ncbi:MAG: N-acetylglucosamine kinase [Bacteroidetes bacterium]|nr:N-acetylglucosamine kinase [Bacteroidota bacterium]
MPTSLLLAESGSTKTDWCLLRPNARTLHFKTPGINPYLQTPESINHMLQEELGWNPKKHQLDAISFYGAGAGSIANQKMLHEALQHFFGVQNVGVQSDMMAAAHALCGNKKGVVCILGTGSNSCFFDGRKIARQHASLGFIAGDEGSGNHLGKRVLQYYAYNTFDEQLRAHFEMLFGSDLQKMLNQIYREPFPNRYLASFVALLSENRGHFMVENIVEDCLSVFFHNHILKYRESWKYPIHFSGSVAHIFRDVIENLCHQYELELGTVAQSPLEGLIRYHKRELVA